MEHQGPVEEGQDQDMGGPAPQKMKVPANLAAYTVIDHGGTRYPVTDGSISVPPTQVQSLEARGFTVED